MGWLGPCQTHRLREVGLETAGETVSGLENHITSFAVGPGTRQTGPGEADGPRGSQREKAEKENEQFLESMNSPRPASAGPLLDRCRSLRALRWPLASLGSGENGVARNSGHFAMWTVQPGLEAPAGRVSHPSTGPWLSWSAGPGTLASGLASFPPARPRLPFPTGKIHNVLLFFSG